MFAMLANISSVVVGHEFFSYAKAAWAIVCESAGFWGILVIESAEAGEGIGATLNVEGVIFFEDKGFHLDMHGYK
jgi:hypothetical protein